MIRNAITPPVNRAVSDRISAHEDAHFRPRRLKWFQEALMTSATIHDGRTRTGTGGRAFKRIQEMSKEASVTIFVVSENRGSRNVLLDTLEREGFEVKQYGFKEFISLAHTGRTGC